MNDGVSIVSEALCQKRRQRMKPLANLSVIEPKEMDAMMILMLAAAMTVAMLIATAFGLHEESRRHRLEERIRTTRRFGL